MIKKQNNKIVLDGTIRDSLNYNEPALSDDDFIVTLIDELYESDLAIRVGTSNEQYCKRCFQHAAATVLKVVATYSDLKDRNKIITEAFNMQGNTHPTYMLPFIYSPFLAGSDVASHYAKPIPAP